MKKIRDLDLMRYGIPAAGRVASIGVALAFISASAFGAAIATGQDNTAGTVLVNGSGIFFSSFVTTGPDTGSYAGNTTVTQGNLVGAPNLNPNLTDWAEFAGTVSGLIKFDLSTLNAGIGTVGGCTSDAVGSVCTPTGSPITLTQISLNSVSMSLSGRGIAYTGTSGTGSTPTIVSFTSQNNVPGTITEILKAVASADGFTNSVSATYSSSTVPEPMTLSMMGLGLVGLSLFSRRRKKV